MALSLLESLSSGDDQLFQKRRASPPPTSLFLDGSPPGPWPQPSGVPAGELSPQDQKPEQGGQKHRCALTPRSAGSSPRPLGELRSSSRPPRTQAAGPQERGQASLLPPACHPSCRPSFLLPSSFPSCLPPPLLSSAPLFSHVFTEKTEPHTEHRSASCAVGRGRGGGGGGRVEAHSPHAALEQRHMPATRRFCAGPPDEALMGLARRALPRGYPLSQRGRLTLVFQGREACWRQRGPWPGVRRGRQPRAARP